MASHTYKLQSVQKNDFMCWNCNSQSGTMGVIVIRDDKQVYATIKKTNPSAALQDLGKGSALYEGGSNLRVEISVPDSKAIDVIPINSNIAEKGGVMVGTMISLCYEDWTDMDYNDYYLHIVAWRKKG